MHPLLALMRRYSVEYTARHDLSVCKEIMVPEYTLHMGGHDLIGRDEFYMPAAASQFFQFPGLGFTVNDIACSGDRVALHFTEHGASKWHNGARASWSGIGLYRWDGTRLVENFVEQDYFARRRQLHDGRCNTVEAPAVAPWDTDVEPPNPDVEAIVLSWLNQTDIESTPGLSVDDGRLGQPVCRLIDVDNVAIDDSFSAGNRMAFHAVQEGRLSAVGQAELGATDQEVAYLHIVGLVNVEFGRVVSGRIVRDRLGLSKRIVSRQDKPEQSALR